MLVPAEKNQRSSTRIKNEQSAFLKKKIADITKIIFLKNFTLKHVLSVNTIISNGLRAIKSKDSNIMS